MALIASSLFFTSCSKDEENSNSSEVENSPIGNTTEKIKNRELFGYWQTDDTKSKRFCLYSDGTGFIESWKYYSHQVPGSPSGYHWEKDSDIRWAYDTETKVLALSNGMALNVKLLTSDMLSAEWTLNDKTRTDTWKYYVYGIDHGWEKLIQGTWKNERQEISFNNGKFAYKCKGNGLEFSFSGKYYREDYYIVLESDEAYDTHYSYPNYDYHEEPIHEKIYLVIDDLGGSILSLDLSWLWGTQIDTNNTFRKIFADDYDTYSTVFKYQY